MKKFVLVGLSVVVILSLAFLFYKQNTSKRNADDKNTVLAINFLQKAGYSEIKILEGNYITAIPGDINNTPFIGALDSLIVSAMKDGVVVKLKIKKIGLPGMSFEKQ